MNILNHEHEITSYLLEGGEIYPRCFRQRLWSCRTYIRNEIRSSFTCLREQSEGKQMDLYLLLKNKQEEYDQIAYEEHDCESIFLESEYYVEIYSAILSRVEVNELKRV